MSGGSATLALVWAAGFVALFVIVMTGRRSRRRGEAMTARVAETRDPDEAEGGLPELEDPSRSGPFAQLESDGWRRVAGRYQDTWAGLTSRFIPPLLDAAGVRAGTRVLDVACGPGLVAEVATERGAAAIGLDFSAEMIAIARSGCPEIEFRRGNALALPFEPGAFDAVVMNFGLLHLPEAERALAEAARVIRPGGAYAFTVWAPPEESPGFRIVQEAVAAHGNPHVSLPRGPDHLRHGRAEEWRRILREAGFDADSVTVTPVRAEWDVPTDFFLFEAERHAGVRTAALLAAQTPGALADIERHVTQAVRAFKTDDGFAIPYAAYVVSARKR